MSRLKNWPSRFAALLVNSHTQPFAWGSHDCCLWGADSVLALTGVDPAASYRGTYDDALGAMRLLDSLGGMRGVASMAGPWISPAYATSGDVGLVSAGAEDGRLSLGVFSGENWLIVGENGLMRFDFSAAADAWRVA